MIRLTAVAKAVPCTENVRKEEDAEKQQKCGLNIPNPSNKRHSDSG